MIKDGTGGSNTQTGIKNEKNYRLENLIQEKEFYDIEKSNIKNIMNINYKKNFLGLIFKEYGLYKVLEKNGINYKKYISKRILPDQCILIGKTLYIIEYKWQETNGSVDEKLQTCDYKKKRLQHLVSDLNWKVEYWYFLNDWFQKKEYSDTLEYIKNVNCRYYFDLNKLSNDIFKPNDD